MSSMDGDWETEGGLFFSTVLNISSILHITILT